jgi:hypothetical protein
MEALIEKIKKELAIIGFINKNGMIVEGNKVQDNYVAVIKELYSYCSCDKMKNFHDHFLNCVEKNKEQEQVQTQEKDIKKIARDMYFQIAEKMKMIEDNNTIGDNVENIVDLIFENCIDPLQPLFLEIFKSERNFVKVKRNEVFNFVRDLKINYDEHKICDKFKQRNVDKIAEKVGYINILDIIFTFSCENCFHSEDEHKVCCFFESSNDDFMSGKYICKNCGCNMDSHKICDKFTFNESQKKSLYFSDYFCSCCGINYGKHNNNSRFPCENYKDPKKLKICSDCLFSDSEHLLSNSFFLLPKEMQREFTFEFSAFSLLITDKPEDAKIAEVCSILEYMARKENWRNIYRKMLE